MFAHRRAAEFVLLCLPFIRGLLINQAQNGHLRQGGGELPLNRPFLIILKLSPRDLVEKTLDHPAYVSL